MGGEQELWPLRVILKRRNLVFIKSVMSPWTPWMGLRGP